MNADVEKAVARLQLNVFDRVGNGHRDIELIKQALRDQEAEIARLRERVQFWKDSSDEAHDNWQADKDGREKAEAFLRELEPILRNSEDYEDRELETYASRITAHLGAEQ